MGEPQDWDIDAKTDDNRPETCSRDLKKYFYIVGAAAVVVLIATLWYTQYYAKHVSFSSSITGAAHTGAVPMAVNWFPRFNASATQTKTRIIKGTKGGFANIAMSLRNSVVNISTTSIGGTVRGAAADASPNASRFANPFSPRSNGSIGSGAIISNDGYIITNYHIVRGAGSANVTVFNDQGSQRYRANIMKMDETMDLALLKIEPRTRLAAAVLGDSSRVRVADEVIAIGSPFGLDQTVSRGIVSALRKSMVIEKVTHASLIQTDAAINQGNSGGPLIAADGSVIGINTAIYTPTGAFSGIGFAIPSNKVKEFIKGEFMLNAAMTRGANPMGSNPMAMLTAAPARANMPGATAVGSAGPPIIAGVVTPHTDGRERMMCANCHQIIPRPGGRVVAAANNVGPVIVAGTPTPHVDGREHMACTSCHQVIPRPGGRVVAGPYQFATPPSTLAMNVAAGGLPQSGPGFAVMGAAVMPIDVGLAERLGHPSGKGIFVGNVVAGSPAAVAGIKPGDIILKTEGQRIATPGEMADIMTTIANGDVARLAVLRDGSRIRLNLTVAVLPLSILAAPNTGAAPAPPAPTEFSWFGIETEIFATVVPANAPGGEPVRGPEVGDVTPGSAAARAGVQTNDVIIKINSQPVKTARLFDAAIKNARGQTSNLVMMMRNGREFYVVLQ